MQYRSMNQILKYTESDTIPQIFGEFLPKIDGVTAVVLVIEKTNNVKVEKNGTFTNSDNSAFVFSPFSASDLSIGTFRSFIRATINSQTQTFFDMYFQINRGA